MSTSTRTTTPPHRITPEASPCSSPSQPSTGPATVPSAIWTAAQISTAAPRVASPTMLRSRGDDGVASARRLPEHRADPLAGGVQPAQTGDQQADQPDHAGHAARGGRGQLIHVDQAGTAPGRRDHGRAEGRVDLVHQPGLQVGAVAEDGAEHGEAERDGRRHREEREVGDPAGEHVGAGLAVSPPGPPWPGGLKPANHGRCLHRLEATPIISRLRRSRLVSRRGRKRRTARGTATCRPSPARTGRSTRRRTSAVYSLRVSCARSRATPSSSWATVTCGWYGKDSSRVSGPVRTRRCRSSQPSTPSTTRTYTTGDTGRNVSVPARRTQNRVVAAATSVRCSPISSNCLVATGVGGSSVTCAGIRSAIGSPNVARQN